MDDFVLWSGSKEALAEASRRLAEFAEERLKLQLKAPQLNRSRFGFPFLGYRVSSAGLSTTRRARKRFRTLLFLAEEKLATGEWDEGTAARHVESALEFIKRAQSEKFFRNLSRELASNE